MARPRAGGASRHRRPDVRIRIPLGSIGGKAAGALTKAAIIGGMKGTGALGAIRHARGLWQQIVGDNESTAHSYCRSALAYAVQGEYLDAERWLFDAERLVGDLARPRFIRGMMWGARGDVRRARSELVASLDGRAKKVTKQRIREVIAAADEFDC